MKTRQVILLLLLFMVGIGAFYLYGYMDQNLIVLKNGTVMTVAETWESGDVIFYEIEDEVFTADKFEIESFGKPDLESILKHARFKVSLLLAGTNDEFKDFANDTTDSFNQKSFWVIAILGASGLCIILLLALHLIMNHRQPGSNPAQPTKTQEPAAASHENTDDGITRSDIINYFLNLFRIQIGADPGASMNTKTLSDNASGPNTVYELRIKHRGEWMQRRMSIGPLGEEAGSKSKCFYVIYDVHLVVKIPVKPISEFEYYLESIKKEGQIVDKLAPKECIVPRVSTILSLIHKLPESGHLPTDQFEEKHVDWLRRKK
jgi:hypothetical protein